MEYPGRGLDSRLGETIDLSPDDLYLIRAECLQVPIPRCWPSAAMNRKGESVCVMSKCGQKGVERDRKPNSKLWQ